MKIAIFSDVLLDVAGGISSSIQAQKAELEKQGHTVLVFCPGWRNSNLPGRANDPNPARLSRLARGVSRLPDGIIRVPTHAVIRPGSAPLSLRPEKVMRWLLREHPELRKFDLVHVHYEGSCSLAGVLLARHLQIPLVQTMHGREDMAIATNVPHPFKLFSAWVLNWAHSWYVPHRVKVCAGQNDLIPTRVRALMWTLMVNHANCADAVITPTQHFADKLRACGVTQPIYVVSNGIPDATLAQMPAARRTWTGKPPLKILWGSRVSQEKRILPFLEALKTCQDAGYTNWQMSVYGGGNAYWAARRFVQLHGLSERVQFYGQISHAEMLEKVAQHQLSVTVSYGFDTQGMTLLEAAAGGLPVLFCDPDMREVVPASGALCADSPAPADMARALQRILEHPERIAKMSAAMLKFRPQVAESVQIAKMLKVYQKVLDNLDDV